MEWSLGWMLLAGLGAWEEAVSWRFSPWGLLQEAKGDETLLIRNLGLVLVKPGWSGVYASQEEAERVALSQRSSHDGEHRWQGRLQGEGVSVAWTQTATVQGNEVRLTYELRAETGFAAETTLLRCSLPTAGNAGKARWVAVSENRGVLSQTFPETLPEQYHLLTRDDLEWLMWQSPSGWALLFDLRDGFPLVNLQDDRRFGSEVFELQLHLKGGPWQEGETLRAQLRLQVLSPTQAQAWEAKMRTAVEAEQSQTFQKRAPFRLRSVAPSAQRLRRYEPLEVRLEVEATYDNPFDPEDIRIEAEVTTPSGRRLSVPGFFTQNFQRVAEGKRERLRKVGKPFFAVRFTPTEVGTYRYRILVTGRGEKEGKGQVASEWFPLSVEPNPQAKGFVRRGRHWHLQFEEGEPFVPVGLDVCWSGNNLTAYERWFTAMREHGANFARIWLVRWNMGLEWVPDDGNGLYWGLGKYSLDNAWRLEELLRIAERNGIYLMLCLGYHGELADQKLYFGEQAWDKNPYSRKNGGPCEKPADFWTNPEARRLYKQRLRYIIARYAHSPHVLAFEFWNEVHAPAAWIREMAQFVRSLDIYGHLLTTTYGDDGVWQLPEMDFVQTHWYGDGSQRDCVATIADIHRRHTERYRKPFLLGEFGIDWRTSDTTYDPQGNALHWHNGMWASLMARGMGTACVWYWDGYIDRLNLWRHFRPVAEFVKWVGKAWLQEWRPLEHTEPTLEETPEPPFGDLLFSPSLGWQRPTGDTFLLHRSGRVEGEGATSTFLFSPSKPDLYRPPKFLVDFPADGHFALRVHTVSSGALLIVRMDGKEVWRQALPEGEERKDEQGRTYRQGGYKERRWDEQWRKWDYIYDREFLVPIPAGKHTLEVDNRGVDWCTITFFRLFPYRDRRFAEVDIVGMQTETMALLWVHHQGSNFQTAREGKTLPPLKGLRFAIQGLQQGRYRIAFWDPWKGGILGEQTASSERDHLPLHLPQLERDIALWVRKE